MVELILSAGALTVSVVSAAVAVLIYFRLSDDIEQIKSDFEDIETEIESIELDNRGLSDSVDEEASSEELFKQNIQNLAERLFSLLKETHDIQDVTTYKEMTDVIEDMEVEDQQLKKELLSFYDTAIKLKYSDEELSEREKEKTKRDAIKLIKKTGESPRD